MKDEDVEQLFNLVVEEREVEVFFTFIYDNIFSRVLLRMERSGIRDSIYKGV